MVTHGMSGYQVYKKNKYETASSHKLISMLYEGLQRFGKQALVSIEEGNIAQIHQSIVKMQDIVYELLSCLNEEQGGEVAGNLKHLYLYMIDRLVEANVNKRAEPIQEVLEIVGSLKSAWEQIGKDASLGNAQPSV